VADFNQINQFGSAKPVRSGEGTSCAECEAMLTDVLDGVLTARQQAAFDRHIATCAECSQMLADAQRGAALLEMLKAPRPEPPAALFDRILAQTSGLAAVAPAPVRSQDSGILAIPGIDGAAVEIHSVVPTPAAAGVPAFAPATARILPFPGRVAARFSLRAITHTMMQPRLAMTAAMAFFSIALTLNLTGVHLNELRASDLAPSNIKRTFYHANASVVRYYDNLRVVYELESRVQDLKRSSDSDAAPEPKGDAGQSPASDAPGSPAPSGTAKPRKAPKSSSGTSDRRGIDDRRFQLAGAPRLASETWASRVPHPSRLSLSRWAGSGNLPETVSSSSESAQSVTALARPVSQLKETPQKGDLA
jgi:hypothetical protein